MSSGQTDQTDEEKCRDVFKEVTRKLWIPRPYEYIDEWALHNRYLSQASSGTQGFYDVSNSPYMREILRELSPLDRDDETGELTRSKTRVVIFQKAAQIGATEGILNVLGYIIHRDPCTALVFFPTQKMSQDFSKDKLANMLADNAQINNLITAPETGGRKGGAAIMAKKFQGGQIMLKGGKTDRDYRSASARIALVDEVDEFPQGLSSGDPIALIMSRLSTFPDHKAYFASTPTVKGLSHIENMFERTDQRYYYVPCPACGEYQVLRWGNILYKIDEVESPENARMTCIKCAAHIFHWQLRDMEQKGEWRSHSKSTYRGWVGFHLSSLYSLTFTWSQIVQEWLAIKGDPAKRKTFVNNRLGETWVDDSQAVQYNVAELVAQSEREDYDANNRLPDGVVVVVASADIQKNRIEFQVEGYGLHREYWLLEHSILMGDPGDIDVVDLRDETGNSSVWRRLYIRLKKPYYHRKYGYLTIACTCIDSRYQKPAVMHFIRDVSLKDKKVPGYVFAVYGVAPSMLKPIWPGFWSKGSKSSYTNKSYAIASDHAKRDILSSIGRGNKGDPQYRHYPRGTTDVYFQQLVHSEYLDYKGNKYGTYKQRPGTANEALDLSAYGLAAFHAWQQLDGQIEVRYNRLQNIYKSRGEIDAPRDESLSLPTQEVEDVATAIDDKTLEQQESRLKVLKKATQKKINLDDFLPDDPLFHR